MTIKSVEERLREAKVKITEPIICRLVIRSEVTLIVPANNLNKFSNVRGINVQEDFALDQQPGANTLWLQPSLLFTLNKQEWHTKLPA